MVNRGATPRTCAIARLDMDHWSTASPIHSPSQDDIALLELDLGPGYDEVIAAKEQMAEEAEQPALAKLSPLER